MSERVSDEVIQELIDLATHYPVSRRHVANKRALEELLERRRGEYICPRCGIRQQDVKPEEGDF